MCVCVWCQVETRFEEEREVVQRELMREHTQLMDKYRHTEVSMHTACMDQHQLLTTRVRESGELRVC